MKINLGAGNQIIKGYFNHDITKHRPDIDLVFDLNDKGWTSSYNENGIREGLAFQLNDLDDKVEEIRAYDVLEHLNDPLNFMNNCWKWLKKSGILDLKVCGWKNPNFYVDITHKKAYDINSFDYFDPTTEIGKEYGYYTDRKWHIIRKGLDRKGNILIKLTPIK